MNMVAAGTSAKADSTLASVDLDHYGPEYAISLALLSPYSYGVGPRVLFEPEQQFLGKGINSLLFFCSEL
jgi:hypothetical protein